jgi:hypothetical protein
VHIKGSCDIPQQVNSCREKLELDVVIINIELTIKSNRHWKSLPPWKFQYLTLSLNAKLIVIFILLTLWWMVDWFCLDGLGCFLVHVCWVAYYLLPRGKWDFSKNMISSKCYVDVRTFRYVLFHIKYKISSKNGRQLFLKYHLFSCGFTSDWIHDWLKPQGWSCYERFLLV